MNVSSDAAESLVRISLQGTEVVLRISGVAAKNIGAILYTVLKDQRRTKGRTRLTSLLKSGKELKIFAIKKGELDLFKQEAKRYGVLYAALIDKKNKNFDGIVDIMVKAEDAAKINRVVERFKLSSYDEATKKSEAQKSLNAKESKNKAVQEKKVDDKLLDDILNKPIASEEKQPNPELSKTDSLNIDNPSENSLQNKKHIEENSNLSSKKSVREELKEIKEEMKRNAAKILNRDEKNNNHDHSNIKPKLKKRKKERNK